MTPIPVSSGARPGTAFSAPTPWQAVHMPSKSSRPLRGSPRSAGSMSPGQLGLVGGVGSPAGHAQELPAGERLVAAALVARAVPDGDREGHQCLAEVVPGRGDRSQEDGAPGPSSGVVAHGDPHAAQVGAGRRAEAAGHGLPRHRPVRAGALEVQQHLLPLVPHAHVGEPGPGAEAAGELEGRGVAVDVHLRPAWPGSRWRRPTRAGTARSLPSVAARTLNGADRRRCPGRRWPGDR